VHACPSESLHFVGLAISACLLTSAPRPSCTANSSAALRATAPVRSLVHAWPCSAPLQPLLPLPFPAPPHVLCTSHIPSLSHSIALSCLISHFHPRFPCALLTAVCLFWHICCLDTGFKRLPPVGLPFWRYRWNLLPKCPKALQSDILYFLLHVLRCIQKLIKSTYGQQNQLST
jgi:hypothetical protein